MARRADALAAVSRGGLRAPTRTTLAEAWEVWCSGTKDGTVRSRGGDVFKPATLRSYEQAMRLRILPTYEMANTTSLRFIVAAEISCR